MTYAKGDLVRITGGSSKWIGLVFTVEDDRPRGDWLFADAQSYGPLLAAGPRPDGLVGSFRWPHGQLARVRTSE